MSDHEDGGEAAGRASDEGTQRGDDRQHGAGSAKMPLRAAWPISKPIWASGIGDKLAQVVNSAIWASGVADKLAQSASGAIRLAVMGDKLAQVANRIGWASGKAVEQRGLFNKLAKSFPLLVPPVLPIGLNLDRFFPPNWREGPEPDLDKAIEVMNEGIPLIWVPRGAIIAELLQAADIDARDDVLKTRRTDIAEDCLTVLDQVTEAGLKPLAGLAADAAQALRDGYEAPAQALAANVFDTWLRDAAGRGVLFTSAAGHWGYKKVRSQIKPVDDATKLAELQEECAMAPALAALTDFMPSDPTPIRYGRHATAHRARPEQYTTANAVVAVMLAASLLRQAESSGW